jgi:hypothetical protein
MQDRNLGVLDRFQSNAYDQVLVNSADHYCKHQVKDNTETFCQDSS